MAYDFNNAGPQRAMGEPIPANTCAMVVIGLRPGGHGEGGWLRNSKTGECLMLDAEFTVDGGPHDRRKFWGMMVTEGQTSGQKTAADITNSTLRAILESARGIMPGDASEAAQAARRISSFGDLDGMRFPARIGVEKGKAKDDGGAWPDKNTLGAAITPDDKDYANPGPQQTRAASQQASFVAQTKAAPVAASAKPAWAA